MVDVSAAKVNNPFLAAESRRKMIAAILR